jgi:ribonuclease-3 family protein
MPLLTEEEERIFKRGRNTAPHNHARGATRQEYQIATGLEALFGWLYLNGENDRLNRLFEAMTAGEEA